MQTTTSLPAPIPPDDRIDLIDIVRGFALFGVMLANMIWTVCFFALTPEQREALPHAGPDRIANHLTLFFADYKFYTLFSMLFGLGFAMQLSRARARNKKILGTYTRRLGILFFMGVAHALLLWFGDILHLYALLGFVLILLRNTRDGVLLVLAFCLALFTAFMPYLHWVLDGNTAAGAGAAAAGNMEAFRFNAMAEGNWIDIVRVNWQFNKEAYTDLSFGFDSSIYWYLSVLWKFILGFVVGRRRLLQESGKHLHFFRRIFPWALGVGLLGNGLMLAYMIIYQEWIGNSNGPAALFMIPVELGVFALSVAYLCGLILLYDNKKWRSRLHLLAPVGRMALTNYLSQSFLLVALFYGVGLGLLGKVGAAACLLISMLFFGVQIILSRWWLNRFRFGPFEWLWRCLTYGKVLPLKRVGALSGHS